jgi:hypothetical protein
MSSEPKMSSNRREGKDQRCTAPHPAKSFLWSLPAFAVVLAAFLISRFL